MGVSSERDGAESKHRSSAGVLPLPNSGRTRNVCMERLLLYVVCRRQRLCPVDAQALPAAPVSVWISARSAHGAEGRWRLRAIAVCHGKPLQPGGYLTALS